MKNKSLFIKVKSGKREEFLQTLSCLPHVRKEKTARNIFMINQDSEDQNVFHLNYEWETDEESESFFKSEKYRVFLGALKTLCAEAKWKE